MADQTSNPAFLRSMWEGAKGYIKGAVAGGLFGAVVGTAVGAIVAAIVPGLGMEVIAGAAKGAGVLGGLFASVGALAGTMTSVVRSRESGKVPLEDAVKAVQVSLAQGMAIEQMRSQAMDGKWRDQIAKERAKPTIDTGQRLHS